MIIGIGCDLVDSRRIDRLITNYGHKFLDRIFTPSEKKRCLVRIHSTLSFSKLFAAKEAAIKAIGGGDYRIRWHDFEVIKKPSGEPILLLTGAANRIVTARAKGAFNTYLTLSDEPPYAQGFVVIESAPV